MFGNIYGKAPDQPHCQQFWLERPGKFSAIGPAASISGTKFARPLDRVGAHQIANWFYFLPLWLLSLRQTINNIVKQPYRPVGT
jgi:hypothetical protein